MIELSKNDIETVGYHMPYEEVSELAKNVLIIISNLYRGLHNAPYRFLDTFPLKETFYIPFELKGTLATFDFDTLTRLVFLAHDLAVRVEIQSTRKHCTLIYFHQRTHNNIKDFKSTENHPTLEQAVKWWRKHHESR